jgi:hypothetical protein
MKKAKLPASSSSSSILTKKNGLHLDECCRRSGRWPHQQ